MDELGFNEAQKKQAKDFLTVDLTFLIDEGTNLPPGWIPKIVSFDWPVPGFFYVSSGYGTRPDPFTGVFAHHSGIDIPAPTGTTIIASHEGIVIHAGRMGDYGKLVILEGTGGLNTYYAHLNTITVKQGQKVIKGGKIGEAGNTGKSTGSHLHFEIRQNGQTVDPLKYFK